MPVHELDRAARLYAKRSGTMRACTLPSERDMPTSTDADKWSEYHTRHATHGTFDPVSIIKGNA